MTVQFTDIERHGEAGWSWTQTVSDEWQGLRTEQRTNEQGEGLFFRTPVGWQQGLGTDQYDLREARTPGQASVLITKLYWCNA